MEKVSVILPTYNRGYCIEKSITSVLKQSYEDLELIVVDDGSTDNTHEVVGNIDDQRIIYLKKENGGAADARNYGIEHASCEYIAFQDSDDEWHSDKIERQMALMTRTPEISFVYHKIRYNIPDLGTIIMPNESVPISSRKGNIYKELLNDNLVDCPSLLAKKEDLLRVGMFDTELKALEDYDLALRLSKKGCAGYLDEILIEKTMTVDSVSQNPKNYLVASCLILGKYLQDYLEYGAFDHRVGIIYEDSKRAGLDSVIMPFLEQVIKLNRQA